MTKEFQGAEATVEIQENKVVKTRSTKEYRHPELDSKLREERTEIEQKLMEKARKYGVNTPETEKTEENILEIEKINGDPLKDKLEEKTSHMEELGRNIAKLHSANIIHGDLTTSNVLVDEELYLIDFGLSFQSERIEDKAVDIHLLKQVLNSSHPNVSESAWEEFVEGYQENSESEEILERLEEVEQRGRYK